MMTNFRSLRCFRRRHLALISIIDMFGESSMNKGASATSLIRRASRAHRRRSFCPVRMCLQRYPRLGGQQSHGDLVAPHLQAEENRACCS